MHHRRATDAAALPSIEHARETDTATAARHILGMPISTISAIVTLIAALFGVWLVHDRAIAAENLKQQTTEQRVEKLEHKDDERQKKSEEISNILSRIDQKLDDVKDRLKRVEDNQERRK